ncbi:MAG: DUF3047 domain-containing protein [Candidatus Rokubacteria bacterium]|nr:DUF3047 domain-containing protein [Candidatus Rokubacteria bacterium]
MSRRRSFVSLGLLVLAVVGLSALTVVSRNPIHRGFYLGATRRPMHDAIAPAASPGSGARSVAASARRDTPAGDPARIEIHIGDRLGTTVPADGRTPGWSVKELTGHADVAIVRADGRVALSLRSDRSSVALYRSVVLDVAEYPILTWSWKVLRLPRAADVRDRARDDQAAQVYVVFPRWPSPMTTSDVIGYVWDTTAPVGTRIASPKAPNVRIIVVESGPERLGSWERYERNVAEDHASLFGQRPPRVGYVAVMTDSNDTRTDTEALVGRLAFLRSWGDYRSPPSPPRSERPGKAAALLDDPIRSRAPRGR